MVRVLLPVFFLLTAFFYYTGQPLDSDRTESVAQVALAVPAVAPSQASHTEKTVGGAYFLAFRSKAGAPAEASKQAQGGEPTKILEGPASNKAMGASPTGPIPQGKMGRDGDLVGARLAGRFQQTSAHQPLEGASVGARQKKQAALPIPPKMGPRLQTILIKKELKRLGCYDGAIDGRWNGQVRQAMRVAQKALGIRGSVAQPKRNYLIRLRSQNDRICGGISPTLKTADRRGRVVSRWAAVDTVPSVAPNTSAGPLPVTQSERKASDPLALRVGRMPDWRASVRTGAERNKRSVKRRVGTQPRWRARAKKKVASARYKRRKSYRRAVRSWRARSSRRAFIRKWTQPHLSGMF